MILKVKITKEDIEDGVAGSCYWCPVARAIRREVKKLKDTRAGYLLTGVAVYCREVRVGEWAGNLPEEIANFVIAFDTDRNSVKPISFELEIAA